MTIILYISYLYTIQNNVQGRDNIISLLSDKCDYLGTNEQVAVDPGTDVATSKTESLKECEKLCDVTKGCNSLLYTDPLSNDTVNCFLKNKTITISDQMIEKKDWTTYYRQCESSKH